MLRKGIHTRQNAQMNPIQGTRHADLIEASEGSWWTVCLAFRPQSGNQHLLGRETFLGRRQEHIRFTAATSVELQKGERQDEAGLTVFMETQAMDTRYLSSETAGGFTGIILGMYAVAGGTNRNLPCYTYSIH